MLSKWQPSINVKIGCFVREAALRETLLNALCHSQYNDVVSIQINIYEDMMYIANCGQLLYLLFVYVTGNNTEGEIRIYLKIDD